MVPVSPKDDGSTKNCSGKIHKAIAKCGGLSQIRGMVSTAVKARLYVADDLVAGGGITPDKDQAHYLMNVMRLSDSSRVALFNGRDGEWIASVTATGRKSCILTPIEQTRPQQASPDLWLLFAPVKKARLDFMAQKASEMGASVIWPVRTDYCQVTRVNDHRLSANAIEAAEQTERLDIAEVRDFEPLATALDAIEDDRCLIWCDEAIANDAAHNAITVLGATARPDKAAILIGPEGGFSEAERQMLRRRDNCVPVSLGPRILRADTAVIAAMACFQSVWGDWVVSD